jgi:hypothetical protein
MFHPDSGDYEFSEAQNASIRKLSSWMSIFGVVSIVWAAVLMWRATALHASYRTMAAMDLYRGSTNISEVSTGAISAFTLSLFPLVLGGLMIAGAASFRKIVTTQGSDIPLLIEALSKVNLLSIIGFVGSVSIFLLMAALVLL